MMSRVVRAGFLVAEGLLVALFLIGFGARYAGPGRFWWAEIIAVGLPFVAAGLVFLTPVHLFHRRWLLALAHLVLLALVAARFAPSSLSAADEHADADALRIMSFNVSPWWHHYQPAERRERMLALVEAEEPHLLFLQEAAVEYHADEPRRRSAPYVQVLLEEGGYATMAPGAELPSYTPQPTLARIPVKSKRQEFMRMDPSDAKRTAITRTEFLWQGRPAVAYNLHLRSFGEDKPWRHGGRSLLSPSFWIPYIRQFRSAFEVRAREAEILARMIEKESLPVLVIGDLNSTPHNWAYQRLADRLQDAFRVAGRGWGGTYHSRVPLVRIDFVLAGPEFEVLSAEVIDSRISDHRPLLVTLRWRESEAGQATSEG